MEKSSQSPKMNINSKTVCFVLLTDAFLNIKTKYNEILYVAMETKARSLFNKEIIFFYNLNTDNVQTYVNTYHYRHDIYDSAEDIFILTFIDPSIIQEQYEKKILRRFSKVPRLTLTYYHLIDN